MGRTPARYAHIDCTAHLEIRSPQGDSGGPLYFKTIAGKGNRPSNDNLTPIYLLGIVSFGSKFCGNGTPGVYTSVKDFVPWIEKIIRKNY